MNPDMTQYRIHTWISHTWMQNNKIAIKKITKLFWLYKTDCTSRAVVQLNNIFNCCMWLGGQRWIKGSWHDHKWNSFKCFNITIQWKNNFSFLEYKFTVLLDITYITIWISSINKTDCHDITVIIESCALFIPCFSILSVPDEGYFERTWWRLFWVYLMKVILSVPDEGY
jgi:hypothetical protein